MPRNGPKLAADGLFATMWLMGRDSRPKQLKILNLTYEIRWVDRQIETATDSHGFCDAAGQLIIINADQKPDAIADTFLHEVNHALFSAFGITGEVPEERIVRLIATGICTVMRDNPDVARWWLKCL